MGDFFTYFVLFSVVVIFIFLLRYFYGKNIRKMNENHTMSTLRTQKTEEGGIDFVRCPLCSTPLAKGEDMTSRIFRPMNTPDQRMIVLGCPHCYPHIQRNVKRICPVCAKEVPLDGHLIARLFNREKNKKHVNFTLHFL